MNSYKTIYKNLVSSRQHLKEEWKPVGSGLERHRIIPSHQGGTYDETNCTYLTHREHIIAHWLLWKIHGQDGDYVAWKTMKGVKCYPSRLGKTLSKEHRRKLSEAKKGKVAWNKGKKRSEETRHKLSEANKGKKLSKEHRQKIGESNRGKKRSEETRHKLSEAAKNRGDDWRRKMSEVNLGRKHSEESRRNMSEAKMGKNNNNFGKKRSEETRKKIAESVRKSWAKRLSK